MGSVLIIICNRIICLYWWWCYSIGFNRIIIIHCWRLIFRDDGMRWCIFRRSIVFTHLLFKCWYSCHTSTWYFVCIKKIFLIEFLYNGNGSCSLAEFATFVYLVVREWAQLFDEYDHVIVV